MCVCERVVCARVFERVVVCERVVSDKVVCVKDLCDNAAYQKICVGKKKSCVWKGCM